MINKDCSLADTQRAAGTLCRSMYCSKCPPYSEHAMGNVPVNNTLKTNPNDTVANNMEKDKFNGLTKREHFAGLAMQGVMSSARSLDVTVNPVEIATYSLKCADALIAELNKEQGCDSK